MASPNMTGHSYGAYTPRIATKEASGAKSFPQGPTD